MPMNAARWPATGCEELRVSAMPGPEVVGFLVAIGPL